ncbi:RAIN protein, partial [Atractosteus spatula]|nr:RAIN protein [Atractosteus spatula]
MLGAPGLEQELAGVEGGVQRALLCGIETQACIACTTFDLLERGIAVHIVADAVSSRSQVDRLFALTRLRQSGAYLTTVEGAILQLVQDAAHPRFKEGPAGCGRERGDSRPEQVVPQSPSGWPLCHAHQIRTRSPRDWQYSEPRVTRGTGPQEQPESSPPPLTLPVSLCPGLSSQMLSEEKKEGSPRFRKLHFPVGLWINSPRKQIAKLGRRWPSAGSVRASPDRCPSERLSGSVSVPLCPPERLSGSVSVPLSVSPDRCPSERLSGSVSVPLSVSLDRCPSRLSGSVSVPLSPSNPPSFLRPRPAAAHPQSRAKRLSHLFLRGRSNSDRERGPGGDREREAEKDREPPGLIKVYGDALSTGANYRSVLATADSSARQLICHVITRYTERERDADTEGGDGGKSTMGLKMRVVYQCCPLQDRVGKRRPTARRKPRPEDFVLCDVVGRPLPGPAGGIDWQAKCRRGVASWERPLLLLDMWRPKEGYERRFEIRRREEYEQEEREREAQRDREGAGYAGVRWRRSRIASGGGADSGRGPIERGADLRRSISDMNLSLRRRQGHQLGNDSPLPGSGPGSPARKDIMSMIETDPGEPRGAQVSPEEQAGAREEEAASSDLERMSQSLILPPAHCPYFLLLQGYDQSKDFVLYIMSGHTHVFGRLLAARERDGPERDRARDRERERAGKRRKPLKVDTFLSAPDLLPRHLLVRRDSALSGHAHPASDSRPSAPSPALVRPFRGAPVTHNGAELYREAELRPGDLLGLGQHFVFLYRDPRVVPAPPLSLALPWQRALSLAPPSGPPCCPGALTDRQEALREYLGSPDPVLRFLPKHIDALLQEIISKNSSPDSGGGALAPAYLLSIMIDHASKQLDPVLLPQVLLKTANHIKAIAWDKIKEFGDKHPAENPAEGAELSAPSIKEVASDLRPLMFWMSNATELLNFFQVKVEEMEQEWEFEAPGDPALSADLDTCAEALALLDDVIMYTFQQCVYHLTKTLYSLLPALLDTNPFSTAPGGDEQDEQEGGGAEGDVSALPRPVAGLLDVYRRSLALTRKALLPPALTSQTFGYLFFFTNTSEGLFSWSRAVQIRTNLDLVLDWLQGAGLGDIATEFLRKLSITVNFLCIPKTRLIQSSWSSLQQDHPLLSPAQLNHLLQHYRLGPARVTPTAWTPPPDTDLSADIFESFMDHPPLILPNEPPQLDLSQPIPSPELQQEVTRLRSFLWGLDQDELPANQRTRL